MSFWMYRKEKSGRRSLYTLGIPIELLFLVVGIIFGLLIFLSRYFNSH